MPFSPPPGQSVAQPSQIAVVNTNPTNNDNQTTVSSVAPQRGSTMFGGRNKQANFQRNGKIGAVRIDRIIVYVITQMNAAIRRSDVN